MLDIYSHSVRDCQGVRRRDFLKLGALAGLGVSLPQLLAARQTLAASGKPAKDVSCILIWTQGGTSHHDTFDPKPQAPDSVRGEFSTISTAVPGIRFSELLPRLSKELNRYALLRSLNPRNGAHGSADFIMLSGHRFSTTMIYPCYGSVVSQQQGFKTLMPPFVQLGNGVEKVNGGGTAGYLGIEHNPFEVFADPSDPKFSAGDLALPAGIDGRRLSQREKTLHAIDALQRDRDADPPDFVVLDKHYQAALSLIASPETKRAFDIDGEPTKLRDDYGRGRFGQSLLLARRLVEAGVRFVTVSEGGWDTHTDNFKSLKNKLMPPVDQGLPALLIDLAARGLLDTTLVVWLTDFGRTPKINPASGRDHWATAAFAVMAGAGVPGGAVLGKTDAEGGAPIEHEYFPENIAATIYSKLGIPPHLMTTTPDGRPIPLCDGQPIREWM